MNELPTRRRGLWLLGLLWSACVTTTVPPREDDPGPEVMSSWQQALKDPSCVVPLCNEEGCSVWHCRDLMEVDSAPVVLARGAMGYRPPLVGNPSRWWGRSLAAPTSADPVFEIPWHHWDTRGQAARQKILLSCIPPPEPLEKHHIFPQQPGLAIWFKSKQIDIHAFTIPLPRSFHTWLHSGGPEGGQWNEAWRMFKKENESATHDQLWQFALELMSRFGVNGKAVPYYCR